MGNQEDRNQQKKPSQQPGGGNDQRTGINERSNPQRTSEERDKDMNPQRSGEQRDNSKPQRNQEEDSE